MKEDGSTSSSYLWGFSLNFTLLPKTTFFQPRARATVGKEPRPPCLQTQKAQGAFNGSGKMSTKNEDATDGISKPGVLSTTSQPGYD